jgi:hypothetical protein
MQRLLMSVMVLLLVAVFTLSGCAHTANVPPPAKTEIKPAKPSPKAVWVPGHWKKKRGGWVWVSGHWR